MKKDFDDLVEGQGYVDKHREYKDAAIIVCDTAALVRTWLGEYGYDPKDIGSVIKLTEMILEVRAACY